MAQYISASEVAREFSISSTTLRRWHIANKITAVRSLGGKRRYDRHVIAQLLHAHGNVQSFDANARNEKISVCYARVSSSKQKADLERQIADLRLQFPNHVVISDIGSGLNFQRPGLKSLLDKCYAGNVQEIVCTHKDRLCRFGFELLQFIFNKHEVKFVVSNPVDSTCDDAELAEDLMAVVTVFVAKQHGRRSAMHKRKRQAAIATTADDEEQKTASERQSPRQAEPDGGAKAPLAASVRPREVDVESVRESREVSPGQQTRVAPIVRRRKVDRGQAMAASHA